MVLLAFAESIQLFPDGTLFVHIALILLMIWVLNRTFFRPVNAVIAAREKFKGGRNTEAEEMAATAAEKQALYNAELLAARSEGYGLIEQERTQAMAMRVERVAAAKAETSGKLEAERKELQAQAESAKATMRQEADVMAERIAENILKA